LWTIDTNVKLQGAEVSSWQLTRSSCQLRDMMQTGGHAAGHSNQVSDIFAPVVLQFGRLTAGKFLHGLPVAVYRHKNHGA
jgi:hypothetical protein